MSLMLKPFRDAQPAGSSVTCAQTDRHTDRSLVAVGAQALESGSWGRGIRDEKQEMWWVQMSLRGLRAPRGW